jgi:hypothetical protein
MTRDLKRTRKLSFKTAGIFLALILLLVAAGIIALNRRSKLAPLPVHHVILKWNPVPLKPGVTSVHYNVYRSPASGGPYTKIAFQLGKPEFIDVVIARNRSYFYAVTVVDQNGVESRFSEKIEARIP